jgi:hypothetical protein
MHVRDSSPDEPASRSRGSTRSQLPSAARGPSAHGLTLPTSMDMRPARDHALADLGACAGSRPPSPLTSTGPRAQLRLTTTSTRPRAMLRPRPTTGLGSHAGLRHLKSALTPACAQAPAALGPRAGARNPPQHGNGPRASLPLNALSSPARDRSTSAITATRTTREPARSSQLAAPRPSPACDEARESECHAEPRGPHDTSTLSGIRHPAAAQE